MAAGTRCRPAAQHHDLPELARFMLATGLRLGEALGATWADLDLLDGSGASARMIADQLGHWRVSTT